MFQYHIHDLQITIKKYSKNLKNWQPCCVLNLNYVYISTHYTSHNRNLGLDFNVSTKKKRYNNREKGEKNVKELICKKFKAILFKFLHLYIANNI
jgi:hypothetical protein